MARGYDSILVYAKLGSDRKFRRLTPAERWCALAGVWAIAAQSPIRGYLLITEDEPASEQDYATEANVTLAVARATVKKMRSLKMIERDEEMRAEHVHDWHEHQKDPKPSDSKEAWRQRKRRQRAGETPSHADVPRDTRDLSRESPDPLREEKKRELPPNPPTGGRKRDRDLYEKQIKAWVAEHFPNHPERTAIGLVEHAMGELVGASSVPEIAAYVHKQCPVGAQV